MTAALSFLFAAPALVFALLVTAAQLSLRYWPHLEDIGGRVMLCVLTLDVLVVLFQLALGVDGIVAKPALLLLPVCALLACVPSALRWLPRGRMFACAPACVALVSLSVLAFNHAGACVAQWRHYSEPELLDAAIGHVVRYYCPALGTDCSIKRGPATPAEIARFRRLNPACCRLDAVERTDWQLLTGQARHVAHLRFAVIGPTGRELVDASIGIDPCGCIPHEH
ncbi:hypothetical protein E7V67_011080 [[Empedobacter] haloabium]|uniref:Uncharacterized protein n=1 Tax=[Empedobacter] haloabium TaxID=592317 RepID=A0ABZ1UTK5_9BURK